MIKLLVFSIIVLPKLVTLEAISRQGMEPFPAPVNPYTELAEILIANYLPSYTAMRFFIWLIYYWFLGAFDSRISASYFLYTPS